MAKHKKTNIVKRITAKSGQIYYFKNGKRISEKKGASEFVKTFFSQIDPAKLSQKKYNRTGVKLQQRKENQNSKKKHQEDYVSRVGLFQPTCSDY